LRYIADLDTGQALFAKDAKFAEEPEIPEQTCAAGLVETKPGRIANA
jgi:hypothetical protein